MGNSFSLLESYRNDVLFNGCASLWDGWGDRRDGLLRWILCGGTGIHLMSWWLGVGSGKGGMCLVSALSSSSNIRGCNVNLASLVSPIIHSAQCLWNQVSASLQMILRHCSGHSAEERRKHQSMMHGSILMLPCYFSAHFFDLYFLATSESPRYRLHTTVESRFLEHLCLKIP